jgi:hypothetical protein
MLPLIIKVNSLFVKDLTWRQLREKTMSYRPTELAQDNFRRASRYSREVAFNTDIAKSETNALVVSCTRTLGYAIDELAKGMDQMAVALRATYILLDKIDKGRKL